jgi:large subunit ribosomal protein L29
VKAAEIREKNNEELQGLQKDLRVQLFRARISNHTNQLNSTAKLSDLRRDIARISTILRQRELTAKGA